jgi:phosphatidylglycerophosphatase C
MTLNASLPHSPARPPADDRRPVLAVFDFDGTLTKRDSFAPFIRSACGRRTFRRGILKQRRAVIRYLLGRSSNQVIKETLITQYFQGWTIADLEAAATKFAQHDLPPMLNLKAMTQLQWHQQQGHRLIIVSANLELYLQPWAAAHGITDVLGTRIAIEDGKVTGKLNGASCYGDEKVERLKVLVGDLSNYCLYAYGDSEGDRPLLEIADLPFYRSFSSGRGLFIR